MFDISMAKCEGATFARSLAFMPLINQDYLSPSLAKARPLRPPGGSCVPPPSVRSVNLVRLAPGINARESSQSGSAAVCAQNPEVNHHHLQGKMAIIAFKLSQAIIAIIASESYTYHLRCPPLARRSPRSLRSLISWSRRGLFVPYARKARPFCPQGGYMCLSLLCALPSIFREYSGD